MQRAFAVLFVTIGVVAALMFGSVAASAQDAAADGAVDLLTPTPTPAPSQAPAIQPDARLAVVGPDAADLWNRAGTDKQATLLAGTLLTAVGRSANGQWLYVYQADGSDPTLTAIHGSDAIVVDAAGLPVLDANEAPDISPLSTVQVNPQTVPTPGHAEITTEITPAITDTAPITVAVNAGSTQLNVRSGPGMGYPVIAKVPTGTVLPVLGRNGTGDWMEVTTSVAAVGTGWVSSAYVRLSQSAGALPVVTRSNPLLPDQTPTVAPLVSTSTSRHQ